MYVNGLRICKGHNNKTGMDEAMPDEDIQHLSDLFFFCQIYIM